MLASCICRIFRAHKHVGIPLRAPVAGEHAKRRYEILPTIPASEAIGRIHPTLRCVRISSVRIRKDLPAKANVCGTLFATNFMGISLRFAVASNASHDAEARDVQPLTMRAFKSIHRVGRTSCSMSFSHRRIGEYSTAEAFVFRVLLASHLVSIAIRSSIVTAETEHVEGLDEVQAAELAFIMVCRIHVARHGVSISSLWVGKEITAKARICRVVLATHCVSVSKGFAIRCYPTHHAERRDKFLRAMQALEPVGWILLASHSVFVLCHLVREDDATITSIARILLTAWHVIISQLRRVLAEEAACRMENSIAMRASHGGSDQSHPRQALKLAATLTEEGGEAANQCRRQCRRLCNDPAYLEIGRAHV